MARPTSWTSELRQDQITRLESSRTHDRTAIAAIEKSLEALVECMSLAEYRKSRGV